MNIIFFSILVNLGVDSKESLLGESYTFYLIDRAQKCIQYHTWKGAMVDIQNECDGEGAICNYFLPEKEGSPPISVEHENSGRF
jgi:hypothetical protein